MKFTRYVETGIRKKRIVQMDIYLKPEPTDPNEAEKKRKDFARLIAKLFAASLLEEAGEHIAAERIWE